MLQSQLGQQQEGLQHSRNARPGGVWASEQRMGGGSRRDPRLIGPAQASMVRPMSPTGLAATMGRRLGTFPSALNPLRPHPPTPASAQRPRQRQRSSLDLAENDSDQCGSLQHTIHMLSGIARTESG